MGVYTYTYIYIYIYVNNYTYIHACIQYTHVIASSQAKSEASDASGDEGPAA